ncbi:MAG: XRE family transcriptional regulator [Eubacteriales bacterium]|nr:XRE family transcriptional regulator [Eubacteriales bacterium]
MKTDEVGKKIAELRRQAGYSQKTLAAALHITDKAISKWERGICFPDVSLLPKLSILLDSDLEVFISEDLKCEEWVGLIEIDECDFSQIVYDKPLVYYLLSHFLLVGITDIYIITNKKNQHYLSDEKFKTLGFTFYFGQPNQQRVMIFNHPWFLFGSNLSQQFLGAMSSCRNTKLVPENFRETVLFDYKNNYFKDKKKFLRTSKKRTLGRGMVCLDMSDADAILDAASFIKMYQKHSGLLIGSLEEIVKKKS